MTAVDTTERAVAEALILGDGDDKLDHLPAEMQERMLTKARGVIEALATKPTTVTEALARVMAELPGIGKDEKASEGQGGYNYRGIEAITREAQPLFARYGVVFTPRVLSSDIIDIIVGGKPWTDTRLLVEYTVYGPGGPEDFITVGPIFAIGRDNSDKGANKCMTQAFKYALLQVLCISDAKDDADSANPERDEHRDPPPPIDPDVLARRLLRERIGDLTPEARLVFGEFCDAAAIPRVVRDMTDEQMEMVTTKLDRMATTAPPEPPAGGEAVQPTLDGSVASDPPEAAPAAQSEDKAARLTKAQAGLVAAEIAAAGGQAPCSEDLEAIIRDVQSESSDDVNAQLTKFGQPTTGNLSVRRQRLARAIATDRGVPDEDEPPDREDDGAATGE